MGKLTSTFATAAAALLLCAMPAWAGHGNWHEHGHSNHSAYGHNKGGRAVSQGWNRGRGENPATDVESGEGSEHPGSNKGGALRGLNRANNVAGEHGDRGRSNAGNHGHH